MITFQRANKNNSAWFTRLSNLTFIRCLSRNRNCFPSVLSKVLAWVKALCSVNQVNPTRWKEQGISGAGSISDRKQTMNGFSFLTVFSKMPFPCYKMLQNNPRFGDIRFDSYMGNSLCWLLNFIYQTYNLFTSSSFRGDRLLISWEMDHEWPFLFFSSFREERCLAVLRRHYCHGHQLIRRYVRPFSHPLCKSWPQSIPT